jgi:protein-tyrosine phosphatase
MIKREIQFDGAPNFRDVGGYATSDGRRVREDVIFRSAAVHRMTVRDARRAAEELGLRTVIDLRGEAEVASTPAGALYEHEVERHHAPLSNAEVEAVWAEAEPYGVESQLASMRHAQVAIGGLFEQLAEPGALPALLHCTAGKDRTGMMVALLLDLLGVAREDILADYRMTERHLPRVAETFAADRPATSAFVPNLEIHPGGLLGTLEFTRAEHGGPAGYLEACGVSVGAIERLRASLVE